MGISTNSHGNKSDKETQSPVLRIFKEIMMRENNDPEKRNLLDTKDDKKRKPYSGNRSKLERRSCESSCSEHRKKTPYKVMTAEKRNLSKEREITSGVFHSDKKDSWWNWKNRSDDTCSCVSCALKRIVGSEYACVGLLMLIFLISILAACFLIFKNVPITSEPIPPCLKPTKAVEARSDGVTDSDRLKRKIEMINKNRIKNQLSEEGVFGKPHYDSIRSDLIEHPGSSELDIGRSLLERSDSEDVDSGEGQSDVGFSTLLEPMKIEKQGNEKLKEFYTKLIQTDAKIKKLKQVIASQQNLFSINSDKTPDRTKRSLKLYNYPKGYQIIRRRINLYDRDNELKHRTKRNLRTKHKWFRNDTDEPTGLVIEKKKVIIQYQPNDIGKKLVAKCSHTPKDLQPHQHENQLKHPFYQNTQRLDELLDRFLNKNLPDIMSDPFGLDFLFQHGKNKCKHPNPNKNIHIIYKTQKDKVTTKEHKKTTKTILKMKNNHKDIYNDFKFMSNSHSQLPRPKAKLKKVTETTKSESHETTEPDIMKLLMPESTTPYERKSFNHDVDTIKDEPNIIMASTDDIYSLLSISTTIYPELNTVPKVTSLMDRLPNLRRLMQMDGEEEENLGYEDFKEVLTDDSDNQDDVDRRVDRRKRDDEDPKTYTTAANDAMRKVTKYNPPGVHNPNWKGPMPLYPDELNTMIQQAAMNANKMKPKFNLPEDTETLMSSANRRRRDLSDVKYVEDYLDNKYDKLVEMAQAYSDYGVLEGKKESIRNEKNPATEYISGEHRVKLSANGFLSDRGFLGRKKKEQYGTAIMTPMASTLNQSLDGLSLEPQSTTKTLDDLEAAIHKLLSDNNPNAHEEPVQNTAVSYRQKIKARFTPKKVKKKTKRDRSRQDNINTFNSSIFISKGRSLLSTLFKSPDYANETDFEDAHMIDDIDDDKFSISTSNIYSSRSNSLQRPEQEKDSLTLSNKKMLTINIKPTTGYFDAKEHLSSGMEQIDIYPSQMSNNKYGIFTSSYNLTTVQTISPQEGVSNSNEVSFEVGSNVTCESTENTNNSIEAEENSNITNKSEKDCDAPAETEPNLSANKEEERNKNMTEEPSENFTIADKVKFIEELERNRFLESEKYENETLISIERSEMKPKTVDGTIYEGVISLTLNIPKVGIENIELSFDAPLPNIINEPQYLSDEYNDDVECSISYRAEINSNYSGSPNNAIEGKNRFNREAKPIQKTDEIVDKSDKTKHHNVAMNKTESLEELLDNNTKLVSNVTTNRNGTFALQSEKENMTLSDFLMMISDWFRTLDGTNEKKDRSGYQGSDIALDFLLEVNDFSNESKTSSTTESAYPLYDADMIENIGHRSRVLLSIVDANVTEGKETSETDDIKVTGAKSTNVSGNVSNSTTTVASTTKLIINNTAPEKDKHTTTSTPTKDSNIRKVKRNAEDSNLIFWNDIYDDEYGIQTENLDSAVADKIYSKNTDFIRRSSRWVQDKIKKFAQNLKGGDQVALKKRLPRAAKSIGIGKSIHKNIHRRSNEISPNNDEEEDYDLDPTSIFNTLGANMMQVCKKAARAVKQTSNIEVKEDLKQSSIATGLMQQVVNLLTDLVDYQVQAKTCTKLPADLQNFLEWLTYTGDEGRGTTEREPEEESMNFKTTLPYPEDDVSDGPDDGIGRPSEFVTSLAPEIGKVDFKTQYLDTLRSIQDLLDQYEEMNDDDKSKMTGVKFYLQNQLRFLNKQLSGNELYNLFEKQDLPLLYKRDLNKFRRPRVRRKRKLYKFIKNFGKKHTRTTASFYDGVLVTELQKSADEPSPKIDALIRQQRDSPTNTKNVRRNLKDVYYQAVAEAKKYAAAKNSHGKQDVVDYSTTKNSRDHN